MNVAQRIVLVVAIIVIAAMVTFPPWLFVYNPPKEYAEYFPKTVRPAGYHFVFSQHVAEDEAELARLFQLPVVKDVAHPRYFSMTIDKDRLLIEVGGVAVITVLLTLLLKSQTRGTV